MMHFPVPWISWTQRSLTCDVRSEENAGEQREEDDSAAHRAAAAPPCGYSPGRREGGTRASAPWEP